MGTRSFPGAKSSRGVTLTPHPLLVPWSWKSRVISLFPLWAVRPVQSLSACTRVPFTFTFFRADISVHISVISVRFFLMFLRALLLLKVPRLRPLVLLIKVVLRLTLILLTWRIGRAPKNASKWQMLFNSAFKGLRFIWSSGQMVLKEENRRDRRRPWLSATISNRNLTLTFQCLLLGSNWTHKHVLCAEFTAALCRTNDIYPNHHNLSCRRQLTRIFLDIWSFHLGVVGNLSCLGCYLVSFNTLALMFRKMFWSAVSGSNIPKLVDLLKLKFNTWRS